jgi:hypothetical protein
MSPPVIWIASYPRSGNTWFRFLLANYFFGDAADWYHQEKLTYALHHVLAQNKEKSADEAFEVLAARAEARPNAHGLTNELMLKTHMACTPDHPFIGRTTCAVYLIRDPRDVLLSSYNYRRMLEQIEPISEAEYARRFVTHAGDPGWKKIGYASWEENARSWAEQDRFPVQVIRYEDLKADTVAHLGEFVEFAGWPRDEARLRSAVEAATMERLRSLEQHIRDRGDKWIANADAHRHFVNSGQSGQSLLHFGEQFECAFVDRFRSAARRFGYDLQTSTR